LQPESEWNESRFSGIIKLYLWGYSFPIPLDLLFAIAAKSKQKNLEKSSAI
jgi:hypothetical protein